MRPLATPSQKRKRHTVLRVALALGLLAALVGGAAAAIDGLMNGSRIYEGVTVGEVDVAGMTVDEARVAIAEHYGPRVKAGLGLIFTSEEDADSLDVDQELAEDAAQAEQLSLEEARANQRLWVADAGVLGAEVPAQELAEEAFAVGRAGGIAERVDAAREGHSVSPRVAFDDEALEALAASIDEAGGQPRIDYDVAVADGVASVVEGSEGTAVDRALLQERLEEGYLAADTDTFTVIAAPEPAPLRIGAAEAEAARSRIQAALDRGCRVSFEGASWDLSGSEMGPWVRTAVVADGEGYALDASLDETEAGAALLGLIRQAGFTSGATVTFQNDGTELWVRTKEGSRYPHTAEAVRQLDEELFGEGAAVADTPQIEVAWDVAPAKVPFDEAVELGLIGEISSYTTEYNDSPATANRRHNIHRAADLLDGSIAPADGGEWSFNDTVGEASEESGFQAAHAIVNGEYDDAIGGGICQVATTVFNAVYEAGFPVTERRNHSLYISSYPTGRDAAIAYPTLDLTWVNDSTSDVLMRARYTDSTITVTLYGVDPGYVVSTQTGEWEKGEPFKKRTQVDEDEPTGTRYVKTVGADGRSVTVHRTVRDRAGNVVHEEDFASNYAPIDEVTVVGPDTPTSDNEETEDGRVLSAGN